MHLTPGVESRIGQLEAGTILAGKGHVMPISRSSSSGCPTTFSGAASLPGSAGVQAGPSNTIVVVDDEEAICEAVKEVLEERGYSVEVAGNGVHAMAIVNLMASHPRLVILDLSMPWMDGAAMLAALRSDPALARIPVIISTADPSPAPQGVPVMKKPFDFDVLLETIRANCD